jgi:hypothetical protein
MALVYVFAEGVIRASSRDVTRPSAGKARNRLANRMNVVRWQEKRFIMGCLETPIGETGRTIRREAAVGCCSFLRHVASAAVAPLPVRNRSRKVPSKTRGMKGIQTGFFQLPTGHFQFKEILPLIKPTA